MQGARFGQPQQAGFGQPPAAAPAGFGQQPPAGGFGAPAAAAGAPKTAAFFKGEKGPGYTDPTRQHWSVGIDFSKNPPVLRDDILFDDLPPSVQEHLIYMHAFITAERDANRKLVETFHDARGIMDRVKGKMDALRGGPESFETAKHQSQGLQTALAELRDSIKTTQDFLSATSLSWEPIRNAGASYWAHEYNTRDQPPSEFFAKAVESLARRMHILASSIEELESSLLPEQHLRAKAILAQQQKQMHPGRGFGLYDAVANATPLSMDGPPIAAAPTDASSLIFATLEDQLQTLVTVARKVQSAHIGADAVRQRFSDRFDSDDRGLFGGRVHQWATLDDDDTLLGDAEYSLYPSSVNSSLVGSDRGSYNRRSGAVRPSYGGGSERAPRRTVQMTYDPQMNRSATGAAAAAAGGGGLAAPGFAQPAAAAAGAPAAGFGAPPAPAGFGAAGAAPAAPAGFGAPAAAAPPAPAGFGAPAAAGFGAPAAGVPAQAGFGAPAAAAPPAPAGFGGTPVAFGASPGGGALSPMAGPAFSPSPVQPSPAAAADVRPTKKKNRE